MSKQHENDAELVRRANKATIRTLSWTIVAAVAGIAALVVAIYFGLNGGGAPPLPDDEKITTPTEGKQDDKGGDKQNGKAVASVDTSLLLQKKIDQLAKGANQPRLVEDIMDFCSPSAEVWKTEMGVNTLIGNVDLFLNTLDADFNVPNPKLFEFIKDTNDKIVLLKIED